LARKNKDVEGAIQAAKAGADFIGLVFAQGSPREVCVMGERAGKEFVIDEQSVPVGMGREEGGRGVRRRAFLCCPTLLRSPLLFPVRRRAFLCSPTRTLLRSCRAPSTQQQIFFTSQIFLTSQPCSAHPSSSPSSALTCPSPRPSQTPLRHSSIFLPPLPLPLALLRTGVGAIHCLLEFNVLCLNRCLVSP